MEDSGYFGNDSITWKIASEAVLTVGGARAVLMQLAHPLVAMGVSAHSSYISNPLKRTESTFILGQMLTFGPTRTARDAARTINHLHKHVHGTLPLDAGDYKHNTAYNARDPELLLWVHATLIDTILQVYPLVVRPLSGEEQNQYYQESKTTARLLGLSADAMPETVQDLQRYVQDMVYSGHLAATPQARQLARVVLFPPLPRVLQPLMFLNLQITCALLPDPVREIYGLEWDDLRQRAFDLSTAGMRAILPHLPQSMRLFPITRRLMEQAA